MNHRAISWIKPLVLAAAFSLPMLPQVARAANLEPSGLNLGATSFFDGFGATQPGLTYIANLRYSRVNSFVDNSGNDVPNLKNPEVDVLTLVNQLAYTTGQSFFNNAAHLGFTGLIPFLHINTSESPGSQPALTSDDGFGDVTVGAYLQFNPVIRGHRPIYSQRFELDVIAPTGRYSSSTLINPSSNFWSLNPYWAATWLPTPRTEVSWRLHYLYNFSNHDTGLPATSSDQAGQAAWVNFTTSYAVRPNLSLGLNGFYFQQLTAHSYTSTLPNIAQLSGDTGKARFLDFGPGIFWRAGSAGFIEVNVYHEIYARNHSGGTTLNIHWIHPI